MPMSAYVHARMFMITYMSMLACPCLEKLTVALPAIAKVDVSSCAYPLITLWFNNCAESKFVCVTSCSKSMSCTIYQQFQGTHRVAWEAGNFLDCKGDDPTLELLQFIPMRTL